MAPEEAPTPWGEEPPALQQPQEELPSTEVTTAPKMSSAFDKLQLLVSLDTALELIHADRESLKRVEAFRGYQGKYGQKVQDALEEVFILLLQAIGNMHIAPGFRRWVARVLIAIHPR
jgi:recyclin-1